MVGSGRAAFRGERHQRRRVAQRRAVVDAAVVEHRSAARDRRAPPHRRARRARGRRAWPAPPRSAPWRSGWRSLELGVGEIAQIADRSDAVARQHVERVGEIAPAVLGRLRRAGDVVAQPIERQLERDVGHGEAALARPRQEVGDVGIEPHVVAARRPQAERAVRALPSEQPVDRRRGCAGRSPCRTQDAPPTRDR